MQFSSKLPCELWRVSAATLLDDTLRETLSDAAFPRSATHSCDKYRVKLGKKRWFHTSLPVLSGT
jgi:hypothetical protein